MKLYVKNFSEIIIERDCRLHIHKYIDVYKKIMIISDDGVPMEYVDCIAEQCPEVYTYIVKQGEESKSLAMVEKICTELLAHNFSKEDLLFAVGGGVVGDLCGYIAAVFRCGMPYVSLPTTTLSQIDSSIGGKTAVNLHEVKNIIGMFHHPSVVLIDLNTLRTLSRREYYSGLVEALKVGLIQDKELFSLFEHNHANFHGQLPSEDLERVIERALIVKRDVVEADEKETGLRMILNFGHTFGHAIESMYHLDTYNHRESVGIGIMMMLQNKDIKERVKGILEKMDLPTSAPYRVNELIEIVKRDKKAKNNGVSIVQVDEIGACTIKEVKIENLKDYIKEDNV